MWAVFPLQDLLALDGALRRHNAEEERINVPSNPRHYWRYRLHLTLEELARDAGANLSGVFTTDIDAALRAEVQHRAHPPGMPPGAVDERRFEDQHRHRDGGCGP